MLDQQRVRPGQSAAESSATNLSWTVGDVVLQLHGEVSPEVLGRLKPRVR
jgi:hypothetical protein